MATKKTIERKAIIFAADVVAYSKHMEQDQVGTLNSLAACEIVIKALFNSITLGYLTPEETHFLLNFRLKFLQ